MRREEVIELIKSDMPDLTDGAFCVKAESDDGGTHIAIYIEDHSDSQKVLRETFEKYQENRIVVLKVPEGYLNYLRTKDKRDN